MMGGDQELTRPGIGGDEPVERPPFEIAREQDPAPRRLDRHNEARLVVGGGRPGASRKRMEDTHPTERIEGDLVSGRDRRHRNPRGGDPRENLGDRRCGAGQEGLGNNDAADVEAFEKVRHAVEMIGVGMGDDEGVDPADPLAPEERRKPAPRRHAGAESPGVVDQTASGGPAHDQAAAMSHRRSDHVEARRWADRDHADGEADRGPHSRRTDPNRRARQPGSGEEEEHRHEPGIPPHRPPYRRTRHPMEGPGNPRGEIDRDLDRSQGRVTDRPPDSGDRPADRRGKKTEESPHHRHSDQRRDEGIEKQTGRTEDMEVGGHQRRCRQPDGGPDEEGIEGSARAPADRPVQRRAGAVDEPVDRVVVAPPGADRRRRADEDGGGEERQLAADAEDLRWVPGEDDDRHHGQGIEAGGTTTADGAEAGQPNQERRAEHRGLAADEDHVEPRRHRHEEERGGPGEPQKPGDGKQTGREERDMEPRDREDVNGPGDHEGFGHLRQERLARAEEEGGGERPALRRKMCPQRCRPALADLLEDRRERRPAPRRQPLDRPGSLDPDHRQGAFLPGAGALVELAWIAGQSGAQRPPPDAATLPGTEPRRRAIDDKHRPAGTRSPRFPVAHGRDRKLAVARRRAPPTAERIARAGERARCRYEPPLDGHRQGPVGEAPGEVIGREPPPSGRAPGRSGGSDGHEEERGGHPRTPPDRPPPAAEDDDRRGPADSRRQGEEECSTDPCHQRGSDDHQWPGGE